MILRAVRGLRGDVDPSQTSPNCSALGVPTMQHVVSYPVLYRSRGTTMLLYRKPSHCPSSRAPLSTHDFLCTSRGLTSQRPLAIMSVSAPYADSALNPKV